MNTKPVSVNIAVLTAIIIIIIYFAEEAVNCQWFSQSSELQ